jgi:acetyl esterase/lipase
MKIAFWSWCFRLAFGMICSCGVMDHLVGQPPDSESSEIAISSDDLGLVRAERIREATADVIDRHEYESAIQFFDKELSTRESGWVLDWLTAAIAHAHVGNRDQAFLYLNKAIGNGLELDTNSIEESLERYGAKSKLMSDPRYHQFLKRMSAERQRWLEQLVPSSIGMAGPNSELDGLASLSQSQAPKLVYEAITSFDRFPQPSERDRWVQYELPISSSLKAPFYVYIPSNYDSTKPTGLIVYLHGGVISRPKFPTAESKFFIVDNPFLPIAKKHNLVMLCPAGMQELKWWDRVGVEAIQGALAATKKLYNIDDSAVWVTGHSNGATGSFALAVTAPSPFAAFYPLNGPPIATRLGNMQHRPIYSIFSVKDGFFPIDQMRTYRDAAIRERANWLFRELPGHDHHHLSYIDHELPSLSNHLLSTRRRPLPSQIDWEAKLGQPSRCDWLQIDETTPGINRAAWHSDVSFVLSAKQPQEPNVSKTVEYGKEIGKIRASFASNTFQVESSQVGAFTLLLHPQMIDFRYPVTVVLNGKQAFRQKLELDAEYMWRTYQRESDRQRVWCGEIRITPTKM